MEGQTIFQKRLLLLLLVAGISVLMGCSADTLQVGIEPTAAPLATPVPSPTPPPLPTAAPSPTPTPSEEIYRNETHGFTFSYPSTWALTEEPNVVRLRQGTLTLRVGYRWTNELVNIDGGRTGVPAGDFISGGKVSFFDLVIPAQVLEFEGKDKAVFYGEAGFLIETGDLVFSIWLDDPHGTDNAELDIPKEIQAEAKAILESLARIEATSQPPSPSSTPATEESLATFIDDAYNLTFQYPPDWVIQEQGTRFVRLGPVSYTHLTLPTTPYV